MSHSGGKKETYVYTAECSPFIGLQIYGRRYDDFRESDPNGFCLAWSYIYLEHRLKNPNLNGMQVQEMMKSSIDNMTDYIRKYAYYMLSIRDNMLKQGEKIWKEEEKDFNKYRIHFGNMLTRRRNEYINRKNKSQNCYDFYRQELDLYAQNKGKNISYSFIKETTAYQMICQSWDTLDFVDKSLYVLSHIGDVTI